MTLTRQTVKGAYWNIGMAAANKAVTLLGQLALAWLLMPSDMGLAGIAISLSSFSAFFSSGSLGNVLVQRGRVREEIGQALWLAVGMGFLAALLIILSAVVAETIGIWGDVAGLLAVIAVGTLLSSPLAVLGAELQSRLEFKKLALCQLIQGVVFTGSAVVFASLGLGAYSLVLPIIPRAIAGIAYMLWNEGMPPLVRFDRFFADQLIKPTFALAGTGVLAVLQVQLPVLFIGFVLSHEEVGYFSWGWMVAAQSVYLLTTNLRKVLLPIFSKIKNRVDRGIIHALMVARALTALLCIVCGLQAFLAEPLIDLMLPKKWGGATTVVFWLSLGLLFQGLSAAITAWLNASGRYRALVVFAIFNVLIVSGSTYLGCLHNGLPGAARGCAIGYLVSASASLFYVPMGLIFNELKMSFLAIGLSALTWLLCRRSVFDEQSIGIFLLSAGVFVLVSGTIWIILERSIINKIIASRSARKELSGV